MGAKILVSDELKARRRTTTENAETYRAPLLAIERDINKLAFTMFYVFIKSTAIPIERLSFCTSLLNRAQTSLVSSLSLIQQGASPDGIALTRIAVETAAVAAHISRDAEALRRFRENTPAHSISRDAIKDIKQDVAHLGRFWASVSNTDVHTNAVSFGPTVVGENQFRFHWGPPLRDSVKTERALGALSVAVGIVFRCAELALLEPDTERPGWLRVPGAGTIVSRQADKLIGERYTAYQKVCANAAQQVDSADRASRGD